MTIQWQSSVVLQPKTWHTWPRKPEEGHAINELILIVEDDRDITEILQAFLEREEYRVVVARDGAAGLQAHTRIVPDLVILDIKLPKMDGVEVLTELRRRGATPVIMSSALGEDLDKLVALRIGADDYLVKPYNPMELVARVKAVLRRTHGDDASGLIRVHDLEVDLTANQARVVNVNGGRVLNLTKTEFRILAHMARAPHRAFTRGEIADACLPADSNALDRTVDSHMAKLRSKLEACGAGRLFEGIRSVGYRLVSR